MPILLAPQEFKGSLTAIEAVAAMAAGVARAVPDAAIDRAPVADGGPGTVAALVAAAGGEERRARCRDPLGRPIEAAFGLLDGGHTAVIEMAAAAGLTLLRPSELDPLRAGAEGVGDLIRAALDAGATRLVIGLGGSATNDGGAGMARTLGARLLDADGRDLPPGGAALASLARIDCSGLDPRLAGVSVTGATDVRNPLCGPEGASAVYGPQKGATPEQVRQLDAALARYAEIIARDTGVEVREQLGAGAAGGLGAGLLAFLHAELRPGFDLVAGITDLERRIAAADLVLTGEGRLDGQSLYGKTTVGVARLARRHGVPVVALCGSLGPSWERTLDEGLTAAWSLVPGPMSLDEAQRRAADLLTAAAEQVTRLFAASRPARTEARSPSTTPHGGA
jgi:glycerate kinase